MPTGRPMRVRNIVASVNSATSTAEVLLAFVLSCPSGRSPRAPSFRGPVTSTHPRPHRSSSRALGASRAPASFAPSSHQVLAPIPPSPPRLHGGRSAPPASPLADRSSSDGGSHRASIGTSASADHPGSLHARRSSRRPGPSSASHPHGAHVVRASSPQLSFRCLTPACSGLAALRTARR